MRPTSNKTSRFHNFKQCLVLSISVYGITTAPTVLAQTTKVPTQAERDRDALRQFPEVDRAVKSVAPIIDRSARDHAERSASIATGNKATVSSRDRPASSPIASPAHNRGAIDVVSPNMGKDAARISKQVGPGYTTIHEQPKRVPPAQGKSYDTHTVYSGGTSNKPPRATAEHVHIQPEFNKRLHEAANPPPAKSQAGKPSSSPRPATSSQKSPTNK